MKQPPDPLMVIIDTAKDGRFYFRYPALPKSRQAAIRVFKDRIFPCYVVPSLLDDGSIYFEVSARAVKSRREILGMRAALSLMETVWGAILDAKNDLCPERVQRLAENLTSNPEAAIDHILQSRIIGRKGSVKEPGNYARNVIALAHWGAIWKLRNARKIKGEFVLPPQPGGLNWGRAADLVNGLCRRVLPRGAGWDWNDFTGKSLKNLCDSHGLDPGIRK